MENQADKSLEATPFKLEEARKKGQVGRSQEFVTITSLIVMLGCLVLLLPTLAANLKNSLAHWLLSADQMARSNTIFLQHISLFVEQIGITLLIMLLAGAGTSILMSILHTGPVFSLDPLKMDFARLNPVNGIKKIFSKKGLFEIYKVILKLVFIAVAMSFLWGQIKNFVLYQNSMSINNLIGNWKTALTSVIIAFLGIFLVFALIDLWFNKRDFARQMRMSSRDLKDEYKKREGDPEIKNKRKMGMQLLLRNAMSMSNIKNADVIITNPTHYAVALQYRAHTMPLPKVLTKGRGLTAKFIINRARKLGIAVYRQPPLARALYKDTAINSYIPLGQQSPVAEIYRSVIKRPGSRVFA